MDIYSQDKTRSLFIPIELDSSDYLEIKEILSSWSNIEYLSKAKYFNKKAMEALYFIALMGSAIVPLVWLKLTFNCILIAWLIHRIFFTEELYRVDLDSAQASKTIFSILLFIAICLLMSNFI